MYSEITTKKQLRQELAEAYKELPVMRKDRCYEFCQSGKCKNECCTITGASGKERKNINNYIREKGLKLPFVTQKHGLGYVLPFGDIKAPKCQYIRENGCLIYEVRPAICRLFGAVKQMPCSYQPRQARYADYPIATMVKTGMMTEEQYQKGMESGGIKLFEKILQAQAGEDKHAGIIKKIKNLIWK